MKAKLFTALAVLTLSFGAQAADKFKLIKSPDLSKEMADKTKTVHIYDANNAETRTKYGAIPGAVMLSSSKDYDLSLLPKDKKASLVFYCANEKCMASHKAAERAVKAGYTQVTVLSDGIMGWQNAGHPTTLKN